MYVCVCIGVCVERGGVVGGFLGEWLFWVEKELGECGIICVE